MGEDEKKLLIDIHREVGITQEQVKNVHSKIDDHVNYSRNEFERINELDAEQNTILAEHKRSLDLHIEGVNTLKDMYVAHRQESQQNQELLKGYIEMKHQEAMEKLENDKKKTNIRLSKVEKPLTYGRVILKVGAWMTGAIITLISIVAGILKIMGKI